jgi:hypothetical protein
MTVAIKNKIKKIMAIGGVKITRDFKVVPLIKRNVFKTNYQKKVLISYITEPFLRLNDFSHTNWLECRTAAEIFHELGYRVDVIDHFTDKKIAYSEYNVIYGLGIALEKSFSFGDRPLARIFYATGCNPIYSNIKTLTRVRDFYSSHKKMLLASSRFIDQGFYLSTFLSDGVIVLGNDFVLNTYQNYDQPGAARFKNLPAFFYNVYDIDLTKKDFSSGEKTFFMVWQHGTPS